MNEEIKRLKKMSFPRRQQVVAELSDREQQLLILDSLGEMVAKASEVMRRHPNAHGKKEVLRLLNSEKQFLDSCSFRRPNLISAMQDSESRNESDR